MDYSRPCMVTDKLFSPEETQRIIELASSFPIQQSSVVPPSHKKTDAIPSSRSSQQTSISCNDESEWLYNKIRGIIASVNQRFNYEITKLEPLQYTEYSADDKGHYEKHIDIIPGPELCRKVSMTIQLSSPEDYEGGDLVIHSAEHPFVVPKELGMTTIFNSWLLHEVKPVTKGKRISMVSWAVGPDWR